MRRVYLFADFGKGPRVSGTAWRHGGWGEWNYSAVASRAKERARAWWLVECESAETGRECIRLWLNWGQSGEAARALMPGRILASGTRESA